MKPLLSVAAALTFLLGLAWLSIPDLMLVRWAPEPDSAAVHMGRRYGVVFIGTAIMLWLSRNADPSPALTGVLRGAAFTLIGLAILTVTGILMGTLGPMAWISAVAEILLTIGFAYQVVRPLRSTARSAETAA